MRQKHVFYELAKKRLIARLTRIMGAYRLGNITMKQALTQSEKTMRTVMVEIQRYTTEIQAKRDLGDALKPLGSEALHKLEEELAVKQAEFREILRDSRRAKA